MSEVLINAGVPWEVDHTSPTTNVFSFPQKAPQGAKVVEKVSAEDQLNLWTMYQEFWCEHKPSITVYYRDSEFLSVGNWVYNNFDNISGISFLPRSDHTYDQAPYEEITKEEYDKLIKDIPKSIEWDIKEEKDNTEGSQTLSCVGNQCEL